jgi:acetylornithine deacetylase/succinyl-diaminopimelate desuccinylase-like protein
VKMPALALLLLATPSLAAPGDAARAARSWRLAHEKAVISEFAELLAIPDVAANLADVERNAERIRRMFEARGVAVRLLTLEGAPPLVVGDLPSPGATATIAFYAHYDGQPVDVSGWTHGPWDPVVRDRAGAEVDWRAAPSLDPESRIYARSAGDDKGSILAMAAALDALRASGLRPAVNLRFVFEGEEEAGSPHLQTYLAKYPEALHADAWLLCDGPVHQSRRMELFFGARGIVDLDLTVYGPSRGLHDGHYGNWAPNPIVMLTHLIDSMRDEEGTILIDGFADEVRPISAAERAAVTKVPDVERALRAEVGLGRTEGHGKPLNELLMAQALNVRGIESGHVGALASNTIQTEARASIDFRLVPGETPESVRRLVERHLVAQGYTIVREAPDLATRAAHPRVVRAEWGAGYPPARTALDLPLSIEVARLMTEASREPILLPSVGASIPMYMFQGPSRTPVIGLPIANHDDNQHAADENLRLQNLWDGIEVFTALFAGLGGGAR